MKNIFSTIGGPNLGPGFEPVNDKTLLFVIISVVIHIIAFLLLTSLPKGTFILLSEKEKEPLAIEMVQLPDRIPLNGELKRPDKVSAYAQRSQRVDKEEYPRVSGRESVAMPPIKEVEPNLALVIPPVRVDGGKESKESKKSETQRASNDNGIGFSPEANRGKEAGKTGASEKAREGMTLMPTDRALLQIARQDVNAGVESPKEGKGMTLLLNTSDHRFQKYFMAVKRRIEFFWDYPPLAARKGQQGRLKIFFVITKDGKVKFDEIVIVKSSNYPILDDAATTAIRLASPFNPFPEEIEQEELTINGSFEYNLRR